MAESLLLNTEPRSVRGKQASRRLRKQGLVPAVVYGHKEATVAVTLASEELEKAIRHGVRVVDLKSDTKLEKALIKEVQWDHLGKDLLHVDFARVAADERVVIAVPIAIRGVAPGIAGGGVLDQPIHTIAVECLAIQVPDSIRVNVNELQLGGVIHVRDLVLPPDVKAMIDPDAVVVQVIAKQVEAEAGVAAPLGAPESAEPEVIGRKATEEEEAE